MVEGPLHVFGIFYCVNLKGLDFPRGSGGGGWWGCSGPSSSSSFAHVLIKHSDLSNFTYFFPVYRTIVGPIVAVIALIISCTIGCVCYRKYNA